MQPDDVVWEHWVEEGTDQLVAKMRLVVLEHDEPVEFEGMGDSQEAAESEAAGAALAHLEAWLLEQIETLGPGPAADEGEGAVPGAGAEADQGAGAGRVEPTVGAGMLGGHIRILQPIRGLKVGQICEVVATSPSGRALKVERGEQQTLSLPLKKEGKTWKWESKPAAEAPATTGRRPGADEASATEGRRGPEEAPGGLNGAETAAILAVLINVGRRRSPEWSKTWEQYCDSRAGGAPVYDPAGHDLGSLEGFFSYAGKRALRAEADSA